MYYVIHIIIEMNSTINQLIGSAAYTAVHWQGVAGASVVNRRATTVLLAKLLHGSDLYRIDDGLIIDSQTRGISRGWV